MANNDKPNVHAGHRDRLRARFLKEGLDNFEDHNVLELLLFYCIPVRDTNGDAHNLMDRFGSLSAVFDADFNELCEVKGIGDKSATLIKMIPELFRKYEIDKLDKAELALADSKSIANYVSKYFKGLTEEHLYVLCMDSNCRPLAFDAVSKGKKNVTAVERKQIIMCAAKTDATNVILVHNHPSGITAPSRADINVTIQIADFLKEAGFLLADHIIIGHGDEYFSFRDNPKWKNLF